MTWPTARLADVCDIQIGRTPSRAEKRYWENGCHPWASIADISRNRDLAETKELVSAHGLTSTNMRIVPAGTVLMSFKLSIGKIAIARIDTCTNEAIAALPIKNAKQLARDYLARALEAIDFEGVGDRAAKGNTLNKKSLAEIRIPLPPMEEQKRIAAILDQADELRRKRKHALDRLNQLGQAIFYEMFGHPAVNPMGWPVVPLGDLVPPSDKINYGVVQPGEEVEIGVPLVRVGDLLSGFIDPRKVKQIDPAIEANYRRSRLNGDEILIGCVGSIGAVALAHSGLKGANIARAVARVSVDPRKAVRAFVAEQIKSPFVQNYFSAETRTVAQPTLNIGLIVETPVVLPPLEKQAQFAGIIEKIGQSLKNAIDHEELENALFSSLQHRAFRGEL